MTEGTLYYNGGVKSTSVRVEIQDNTLVITHEDNERDSVHRDTITVKPKLGQLPREIAIPELGLLSCTSTTEIDDWLDTTSGSRLFKLESRKRWIFSSIVLVPLLLYGLFAHVLPMAAVYFAEYVPYSVKRIASQQTLSALDYTMLDPSALSDKEKRQLLQGFNSVLAQIHTRSEHYDVQFRYSEELGPNAFALPDGTIVFTDQLVDLMEKQQHLLDAILLHEIGHVEENHSMRMVAETLVTTLAISYFFGDLSGAIEAFFGIGNGVVQNQFSQEHEWQADKYALEQLLAIGRTPGDFADAMRTFSSIVPDTDDDLSWLQTHPGMQERIQHAENAEPHQ